MGQVLPQSLQEEPACPRLNLDFWPPEWSEKNTQAWEPTRELGAL